MISVAYTPNYILAANKAVLQLKQKRTIQKENQTKKAVLKNLQSSTDDWFPTLGENGFLCSFPTPKTNVVDTGSAVI